MTYLSPRIRDIMKHSARLTTLLKGIVQQVITQEAILKDTIPQEIAMEAPIILNYSMDGHLISEDHDIEV